MDPNKRQETRQQTQGVSKKAGGLWVKALLYPGRPDVSLLIAPKKLPNWLVCCFVAWLVSESVTSF